jgi:hypothetical protein
VPAGAAVPAISTGRRPRAPRWRSDAVTRAASLSPRAAGGRGRCPGKSRKVRTPPIWRASTPTDRATSDKA